MKSTSKSKWILGLALLGLTMGCQQQPSNIYNSDPALRKTAPEYKADAATRHPYNIAAPKAGDLAGKADVDYNFHPTIQIANLSDFDWVDVDVWINQAFVVHVPNIERSKDGGKVKTIDFEAFYDANGDYFKSAAPEKRITKIEIYLNGKMYNLPMKLAD